MQRGGTIAFYHADGLGSITSLTDGNGATLATYAYDSFGKTTTSGGIYNPFQYTGRENDSETGLYYYRARYYDPQIGRFVSEDPIGFGGGVNFYAYVANDPILLTDSTGLCFSKRCLNALKVAHGDRAGVLSLLDSWSVMSAAAQSAGIDPDLLAAIAIRETDFQNIWEKKKGGLGAGYFQIDLGKHPNVNSAQAFNLQFAAQYAANLLAKNEAVLAKKFPAFTQNELMQATAASYNFGTKNIHGNPGNIDKGTTGNNYGSNVLDLMDCFQGQTGSPERGAPPRNNSWISIILRLF